MESIIIISAVVFYVITFKISIRVLLKYLEELKEFPDYDDNVARLIRYLIYCFIPIVNIFIIFVIAKKVVNLRIEKEREHLRTMNLRRSYWEVKKEEPKGFGLNGGLKLNL